MKSNFGCLRSYLLSQIRVSSSWSVSLVFLINDSIQDKELHWLKWGLKGHPSESKGKSSLIIKRKHSSGLILQIAVYSSPAFIELDLHIWVDWLSFS